MLCCTRLSQFEGTLVFIAMTFLHRKCFAETTVVHVNAVSSLKLSRRLPVRLLGQTKALSARAALTADGRGRISLRPNLDQKNEDVGGKTRPPHVT